MLLTTKSVVHHQIRKENDFLSTVRTVETNFSGSNTGESGCYCTNIGIGDWLNDVKVFHLKNHFPSRFGYAGKTWNYFNLWSNWQIAYSFNEILRIVIILPQGEVVRDIKSVLFIHFDFQVFANLKWKSKDKPQKFTDFDVGLWISKHQNS